LENGAEISGATGESYSNTVGKPAGTYVYVRMAYTAACGWQNSNAFIVYVTGPVAAPASPSANSRCGNGTVTFSASVPGGITIDWYNASSGGAIVSGGTGVTSISPALTQTTTYYAQARNTTTNCVSAARTAVTATINAVPTITRTGGDASQTVTQNTAITAITYTASNATGIALSSGSSFPTGVSGNANGLVYTISGTPSAAGTFNYSVTASHTNGCSSAASSGTITVTALATDFYSSNTWSYGGYTWSDRVVAKPSGCSQVSTLSTTTSASPPAQYKINSDSGVERYYYNWTCALTVCPSGWSLPTRFQISDLVNATNYTNLINVWGYGGYAAGSSMYYALDNAFYWSSNVYPEANAEAFILQYRSGSLYLNTGYKFRGMQVRCVK
jgi:hypothetical protein